jgi:hypothetical protein
LSQVEIGASSSTRRRETSLAAVVEVNTLLTEPSLKRWAGVAARSNSRSAFP